MKKAVDFNGNPRLSCVFGLLGGQGFSDGVKDLLDDLVLIFLIGVEQVLILHKLLRDSGLAEFLAQSTFCFVCSL